MLPELGWAAHPSSELRARLADYLGHGWTITSINASSAVVRRAQRSSALVLINPFYAFRRKPAEEVLLTVSHDGTVTETRR
jgi:hypothetical protein